MANFFSDRLRFLTGSASDAKVFWILEGTFDDVTVVLVGARIRF
jgi:hypothetical protein